MADNKKKTFGTGTGEMYVVVGNESIHPMLLNDSRRIQLDPGTIILCLSSHITYFTALAFGRIIVITEYWIRDRINRVE